MFHLTDWRFATPWAVLLLVACGGTDSNTKTDTSVTDTHVGDTTDVADTDDTSPSDDTDTVPPDDTDTVTPDDTDTNPPDDADTDDTTPPDDADTDDTDTSAFCPATNRPEGCACDNDADCGSGLCASGPVGDYCASPCTGAGDCTGGSTCVVGPGQTNGVCLVEIDFLCAPCKANADCRRAGGDAACVPVGNQGSFCAVTCDEENPCFDGYSCNAGYCVPDSGRCECSELASAIGARTDCSVTNGFGTCGGERVCGLDRTLSPCNAAVPSAEVCDGVDNDCNIGTAESGALCDDGNPCTTDVCNGAGGCQNIPLTGTSCNDGNACTGPDICTNGVCGGDDICPCTPETVATDCTTPPQGQTMACLTPSCTNNVCVYAPKTGTCDDGSACTTNDTCNAGACSGTARSCDDGNACTQDACDPGTGCVNTPFSGACEDGNPCTVGDTCATGICVGTELDCSDLDGTCHLGVCDGAGGCFAQSLACGVTSVRFHTPSAAFARKGAGNTWFTGSVGHESPVGVGSTAVRKVQFGFHPGMHR